MNWVARAFLLWVTLANVVWSAPFDLRTGDHENFTRVVIDMDGPREWAVEQDGRRVTIAIDGHSDGFFTVGAFARISRDRLAELSPKNTGAMDLQLGCDCVAEAFLLRDRMLVVDIRELREGEQMPTTTVAETPLSPPDTRATQAQLAPEPSPILEPLPRITLPLRVAVASTQMMTRMMAQDLDAAVAAGLISAETQMRIDRTDAPAQKVIDPQMEVVSTEETHAFCPAGVETATQAWIKDGAFSENLSGLRAALFDVTGRQSESARLALARFYVGNGAGLEALGLLQDRGRAEAVLVRAMAETLDRPHRAPQQAFQSCPGLAIWEVIRLSRQRVEASFTFDDEALVLGFRGLSAPLQSLFETEVLRYLEGNGYRDAAQAISLFRERTQAPQILEAENTLEAKAPPKQIDENEILIRVLDRFSTLAEAGGASRQEHELLAAFQHEYKETSWSAELWAAEVRAHLAVSDFDGALASARKGRRAFPDTFEAVYPTMLRHVTDAADDITFLKIAMAIGAGETGLPVPTADVAAYVEKRVGHLGF